MKKPRKSSGRMASKGFPNPIDVHIGGRIRTRRTIIGVSQEKLAEGLGITFQQVQKYEKGANRISGSRIWDLSRLLDVPVGYFFEDISAADARQSPATLNGRRPDEITRTEDPMLRRETLELVRPFYAIGDRAVRKSITGLVRACARQEE